MVSADESASMGGVGEIFRSDPMHDILGTFYYSACRVPIPPRVIAAKNGNNRTTDHGYTFVR